MADLPETLTITVAMPPSQISAGSSIQAISTIGLGVPGQAGPAPAIIGGDVITLAPGSLAQATLTQIAPGVYELDLGLPRGDPGLGSGDMLKSVYDPNNDGKVSAADAADAVPWTGVSGKPSTFPPSAHNHNVSGLADASANGRTWLQTASYALMKGLLSLVKSDVGLGNVDNTSDANKPVSTAQAAAIGLKQNAADKTVAAEILTGTDNTKHVTALALAQATAISSTIGSGTWNPNFATQGTPRRVANGASTLGAPTNGIEGRTYVMLLVQDATGGRTWSFATNYDFGSAGTPTASTGANKIDVVVATCIDASTQSYRASFSKAS